MTIYYISTTGSDSGTGSETSPWRTISKAMAANLKPGDEVVVRPGTYNEAINITKDGSASGYITLRSEVPGEALIRPPASAWNAISVNADYVAIDGFDIGGARGDGIEASNVHHIKVLNNTVHGSGESGIQFNGSEFITIEGNETYENASSGWFSGISIYQNRNVSGDTTTEGYRTIVRNNISHDNVTTSGLHTDGNGIIIDDFRSTQTSGYPAYNYPTLVENNLVYENGGKGIQVYLTDNVTVRNNTAYHNNQDLANTGTYRGELSNQDGSNNVWVNNIAVADPSVNRNNTAVGDYGPATSNTVWSNNLTFNGTTGQASVGTEGGTKGPTAAGGNKLGVDPKFVDAANGDFTLKAGSPAIDAGTAIYGLGSSDLDGGTRTVGTVDVGAYEYGVTASNSAPGAITLTGGSVLETAAAGTVVGQLASVDPDGDAVRFAVSGDSRFTVDAGGRILVASGADLNGVGDRTTLLTVEASDGRGGVTTKAVSVTILDVPASPPPAVADTATVAEDGSVRIAVLANDGAVTLVGVGTSAGVSGPTHGTVAIVGSEVIYTPTADYNGTDSFDYRVRSADGTLATATVTVTVIAVNDAPVATADTGFEARSGTPLVIPLAGLLANDRDVDGDTLTVTGVGGATKGTVALDGQGNVVFTPTAGATGDAGFTYTVSDGKGGTATATVGLHINEAGQVHTVWDATALPSIITDADTAAVELGMRFTVSVDGEAEAIRFYKGPSNTGTHTARLWSEDGRQLASVTFTAETSQGWQEVALTKSVTLEAGETYIVSYHAPNGHYSVNESYFATAVTNGPITALDGVYRYGSAGSFPDQVYHDSNYWVDVVFDPDDNAAPAVPVLSAGRVAETAGAGTVIGRITASDPDGDPVSLSVSNPRFAVTASGDLVVAANTTLHGAGDRTLPLTITADDGNGGISSATVAITIRDMPAVGNMISGSRRADTLNGTSGRDLLSGLGGNDALNGGGGNDELVGGSGRDQLSGGRGADDFIFAGNDAGVGSARDVIRDFSRAEGDIIDLTTIDANATVAGDQAFVWIGGAVFSGQAGELRYASGMILADMNGDRTADLQIELTGTPVMLATDFAL